MEMSWKALLRIVVLSGLLESISANAPVEGKVDVPGKMAHSGAGADPVNVDDARPKRGINFKDSPTVFEIRDAAGVQNLYNLINARAAARTKRAVQADEDTVVFQINDEGDIEQLRSFIREESSARSKREIKESMVNFEEAQQPGTLQDGFPNYAQMHSERMRRAAEAKEPFVFNVNSEAEVEVLRNFIMNEAPKRIKRNVDYRDNEIAARYRAKAKRSHHRRGRRAVPVEFPKQVVQIKDETDVEALHNMILRDNPSRQRRNVETFGAFEDDSQVETVQAEEAYEAHERYKRETRDSDIILEEPFEDENDHDH